MRNQDAGFKSDRSSRGSRNNDRYGSSSRFTDDEWNDDRGNWDRDRDDSARDRDWNQDATNRGRDWEKNDYADVRGRSARNSGGADDTWNERRDLTGRRRWSGEGNYGQPIYGGGEFEGGFGWSGGQPGNNWRSEGASGSDAYGYGRGGSGGREQDDARRMDWDDDYRHWRTTQVSKFDEDYNAWRNERRQKFADEFDKWRQGRSGNSGNLSSGGTAEATAKEPRK